MIKSLNLFHWICWVGIDDTWPTETSNVLQVVVSCLCNSCWSWNMLSKMSKDGCRFFSCLLSMNPAFALWPVAASTAKGPRATIVDTWKQMFVNGKYDDSGDKMGQEHGKRSGKNMVLFFLTSRKHWFCYSMLKFCGLLIFTCSFISAALRNSVHEIANNGMTHGMYTHWPDKPIHIILILINGSNIKSALQYILLYSMCFSSMCFNLHFLILCFFFLRRWDPSIVSVELG